ncbi:hypothetical protein A2818_02800 [Candidatus Nomurabacteria bacterium RIFCSPHIGHO2_01_FULL_40_12]|uniref:DUF4190 domain-containing protein n=1 Tax=Candidatus Nomurabacteria bacterium RIFCSPHIGHO2_01_FULL_40_12 TaxID=1801737 RepID=A0A1F6V0Y9_9BACT|nr:MAG: hypothetical protein A2818_02800 [Candidatus Nomurabacteria bacterium RIFCSPHIGHO2_01_FULL_40_12]
MKKKLIVLSGFVLGLAPVMVFAQSTGGAPTACGNISSVTTLQGLLCKLSEVFNAVLPILIALGVVFFVWGVLMYVLFDDEEAKKRGRDRMIWGIIGLAVIIGLWGLVRLLTNTFDLGNRTDIKLPTTPY